MKKNKFEVIESNVKRKLEKRGELSEEEVSFPFNVGSRCPAIYRRNGSQKIVARKRVNFKSLLRVNILKNHCSDSEPIAKKRRRRHPRVEKAKQEKYKS